MNISNIKNTSIITNINVYKTNVEDNYLPQDGVFMIRKNTRDDVDTNPYVISIWYTQPYHLKIRRRDDNKYAIGTYKVDEPVSFNIIHVYTYRSCWYELFLKI